MNTAIYGALTFLSCLLEVSVVFKFALQAPDLLLLVAATLAFHVGNLAAYMVNGPRWAFAILVGVGAALLVLPATAAVGMVGGVFALKAGTQVLRREVKESASQSEVAKAIPRIVGFVMAVLVPLSAIALLAIAFTALLLAVRRGSPYTMWALRTPERKIRPPYVTYALHSAHYFSFGYAVPLLLTQQTGWPPALFGLVYSLGWLGYYAVPLIAPHRREHIVWGHLLCGVSIPLIYFSSSPIVAILAWVATGVGGGTIFLLPRMRARNFYDSVTLDLWDNGANVIGLGILALTLASENVALGFVAGALISGACGWVATRLENPD